MRTIMQSHKAYTHRNVSRIRMKEFMGHDDIDEARFERVEGWQEEIEAHRKSAEDEDQSPTQREAIEGRHVAALSRIVTHADGTIGTKIERTLRDKAGTAMEEDIDVALHVAKGKPHSNESDHWVFLNNVQVGFAMVVEERGFVSEKMG